MLCIFILKDADDNELVSLLEETILGLRIHSSESADSIGQDVSNSTDKAAIVKAVRDLYKEKTPCPLTPVDLQVSSLQIRN